MIGQVLNDRYEILEKVGEGGMAITYRGRDRLLGRTVAVKVMRPELAADAEFLSRFRREARAAAGVTHEHIASVYDTGSHGPYHYIVMEFVEGESLHSRLRREGPLPLEEALRIATGTAEALDAAHSMGVIHRDIKPHNILLGREDRVKVTDFGIARAISSPGHTETGRILGSVHYMSPEQARGDVVGPQADIYSLGATLFEMLTGRPPFDGGERLAILHQHIYDRPPQVSDSRPGLPPEADSLVAHSLEKELPRRFASARELLGYLAACPRTETAVWRTKTGWAAWMRRAARAWSEARWGLQRQAIWVALAILVLASAAVGITLWASSQARAEMVPIPDVLGMSGPAAREYLRSLHLEYREVGRRASEDMAYGAVLAQDPPPDLEVREGAVVKVVLSEGPSHVVVPNVTQMSAAQAKRNLDAAGLVVGRVDWDYHETVPAGYVASTLPQTGARVVRGTAVDLIVSRGPAGTLPPSVASPPETGPEGGRTELLTFIVPAEGDRSREVTVTVEVLDERGKRKMYEGKHTPGEAIPPQRITVTGTTTARIFVDGKLRAEREYLP